MLKLTIAGYEIVLAPAGLALLLACIAILVVSVAVMVRMLRRRGQP